LREAVSVEAWIVAVWVAAFLMALYGALTGR
jgi:uncharacterized membrane protein required for colicin V production